MANQFNHVLIDDQDDDEKDPGESISSSALEQISAFNPSSSSEGSLDLLAKQASITLTNAGVRVDRARQALKKQVELAYSACAEHGCLECGCKSRSLGD